MKQILFFVLFASVAYICKSQELLDINYSEIEAVIKNPDSEFYYPTLLQRYNDLDSTLTVKEYIHIYYGFSFQANYLSAERVDDNILKIAQEEDYEKTVAECERVLKINPVSLDANNEMGYALFKLGKPESEWKQYQKHYRMIRGIIAYSGNGLSAETAFKVIFISDEYKMMYSYFEIPEISSQSLIGSCDYFKVTPSEYYQKEEIYFDISRHLIRTIEEYRK